MCINISLLFIHLLTFRLFHVLFIVNNASLNNKVLVSFRNSDFISSRYIPINRIAGSQNSFIFNPLRLSYLDGSLINIQFNLNQSEGFLPLNVCLLYLFLFLSYNVFYIFFSCFLAISFNWEFLLLVV